MKVTTLVVINLEDDAFSEDNKRYPLNSMGHLGSESQSLGDGMNIKIMIGYLNDIVSEYEKDFDRITVAFDGSCSIETFVICGVND